MCQNSNFIFPVISTEITQSMLTLKAYSQTAVWHCKVQVWDGRINDLQSRKQWRMKQENETKTNFHYLSLFSAKRNFEAQFQVRCDNHRFLYSQKRSESVILLDVATQLQKSINTRDSTVFSIDKHRASATRLSANNRKCRQWLMERLHLEKIACETEAMEKKKKGK